MSRNRRPQDEQPQAARLASWVPAHKELRAILNERKAQRRSPIIVVGAKRQPFTQTSFQTRFFGLLRRLREAGTVAEGPSFHGLRHTLGRKLAEAGGDARTNASILGQKITTMAEHHSRHANRRYLARAAIAKLERNGSKKRKTEPHKSRKATA